MKRSILVDEKGAPLSIVICGANEHDITQLKALLEAKIVEAPKDRTENLNFCLDAGFIGAEKRLKKVQAPVHSPHPAARRRAERNRAES